jgi:hypothetical protein
VAPTVLWCSSACDDFVASLNRTEITLNHHRAPAVNYPTGRSGYLAVALCGVLLLGAVSAGFYFFHTSTPSKALVWQLNLIGLAWISAALGVFQFLSQLPVGELVFDGVDWYFSDKVGHEKVGSVRVRLDGQNCLLLRFEDDLNKVDWIWLEARFGSHQAPNYWLDLRRAVYSRATAQNLPNLI